MNSVFMNNGAQGFPSQSYAQQNQQFGGQILGNPQYTQTTPVQNTFQQPLQNQFQQPTQNQQQLQQPQNPAGPNIAYNVDQNMIGQNTMGQNLPLQKPSTPSNLPMFLNIHTSDSIVFKCLSKLLLKNFTEATFMVTEQGIFVQENKEDDTVLIESFLRRDKFDGYIIPKFQNEGQVIIMGFSTKELQQALDGITKTDRIRMYILMDRTDTLCFEITNEAKKKNSSKFILLKKTNICNTTSPAYDDYKPTAVVDSVQFKRAMTDANKSSKQHVRIRAQESGAVMTAPKESQISNFREIWGNWVEDMVTPVFYDKELSTSRLHGIGDLAPLTKLVRIYACSDGRPLKLMVDACGLGTISIYLQPDV